jgi:16S rRNA (cytosine967-C5)-methyltransferase
MVYATCSILPSENQDQIAKFLATDIGKVQLRQRSKKFSSESGFDGFYMAL